MFRNKTGNRPARTETTNNRRWRRRLKRCALATAVFVVLSAAILTVLWFVFPFPIQRLENWPASPLVTDRAGRPMLELVDKDGQWRFPVPLGRISPHLIAATIAAEDKRFYDHHGVDLVAGLRACGQNIAAFRTVSGASTLTMQVCRMMDDRPRSLWSKSVESFRALQLERVYSKDRILETYLNIAPYGRNIRGAEAAAMAYFGKHADELSLAEAATLAGLPQSPNRLRPDKHPEAAAGRAKVVLARMVEAGMISHRQMDDALAEPVIAAHHRDMPRAAHAAWMALAQRPSGGQTTIDPALQAEAERLLSEQARSLPDGTEAAIVIIDISTGRLAALVGSRDPANAQVNGAIAWRSPGSALKPFIYAAAFESRRLGPDSTVYDIPIHRAGWSPANFDKSFSGQLPTAEALRRSLNVPAILVAEGVGLPRCVGTVESAGVKLPPTAASRGGLAIVTGAIEVRLLDLTNAYATIGRGGVRKAPALFTDETPRPVAVLDPAVCATLDDILSSRNRRPHGMEDMQPDQVPWLSWKTGTSSSRRDALAVGHNRRYAIGVWVGHLSGSPDAALLGAETAEPLLARLFSLPNVRNDAEPPAPAELAVSFPLPPPAEVGESLKITYPRNGAVFLSLGGQAVVRPDINRCVPVATDATAGPNWFLNGMFLEPSRAERLVLSPGRYELRCTHGGESAAVRFVVK